VGAANEALLAALLLTALVPFALGACSMKSWRPTPSARRWPSLESMRRKTAPDFVKESLPFALKTLEGLQRASPENPHLLLALSTGLPGYALLLKDEADRLGPDRREEAQSERGRASAHYMRARDYALALLEERHPGLREEHRSDT
jgi:hypothetical protein